jgi:predicted nucleic acid-binding protein
MLEIQKVRNNKKAQSILENCNLGKGETSTLYLFFNVEAKTIISEDRVFLNLLLQNNIPFITPTDLIVRLYELKIINKKDALSALSKIKPYVNKNSYNNAKTNMED